MYAAILVVLSASATLAISNRAQNALVSAESPLAADGAYRDGMYLGTLAAESGRQASPPVGRWSTEQDRSSFTAGYRRGFDQNKNPGSR